MERGGIIKHDLSKSPKTGEWRYMKPEVDPSKCLGCGTCVPHCPEAAMELKTRDKRQETIDKTEKKLVDIDFEYCKGCGVCSTICPLKAISMRK